MSICRNFLSLNLFIWNMGSSTSFLFNTINFFSTLFYTTSYSFTKSEFLYIILVLQLTHPQSRTLDDSNFGHIDWMGSVLSTNWLTFWCPIPLYQLFIDIDRLMNLCNKLGLRTYFWALVTFKILGICE